MRLQIEKKEVLHKKEVEGIMERAEAEKKECLGKLKQQSAEQLKEIEKLKEEIRQRILCDTQMQD